MKFALDSVTSKSKSHNEDFCFDLAMPRGHFFAVLDFGSHDYSNLNAALRSKLETIVGSFSSLPDFSDDLFLGFLAKEINNFVHNLAAQSGDPQLLFSAALCLLSGNRLSYFCTGTTEIRVHGGTAVAEGRAPSGEEARLGGEKLESPLSDRVQSMTLGNADVVLIMTGGVSAAAADSMQLSNAGDPKLICELLIKGSETASEDRTVVAICGPYEAAATVAALDNDTIADLKASIASLESRMDALSQTKPSDALQLEQEFQQQIEALKGDLSRRPASIDLLEFEEKLKGFESLLASKANTADVLGLQRDVLKLGLTSNVAATPAVDQSAPQVTTDKESRDVSEESRLTDDHVVASARTFPTTAALVIVVLALLAGFGGGWLQSRLAKKTVEAWSVKTSGNELVISRLDSGNAADVTMTMVAPLPASGEQRFSSFADVKRYVDTITTAQAQSSPVVTDTPQPVNEIIIKPGDSLKKIAQSYNVPEAKIMELNPAITKWGSIQVGRRVVVPGSAPAPITTPTPAAVAAATPTSSGTTTEITVGPGDSLNELARRFNTTSARLRELNPSFNWPRIQAGQKVIVPANSGG